MAIAWNYGTRLLIRVLLVILRPPQQPLGGPLPRRPPSRPCPELAAAWQSSPWLKALGLRPPWLEDIGPYNGYDRLSWGTLPRGKAREPVIVLGAKGGGFFLLRLKVQCSRIWGQGRARLPTLGLWL